MDAERIREHLGRNGYNFSRIAKILQMSPVYVSLVARRRRQNHRVAIAVATAIGTPVNLVFPDVPLYHGPLKSDEERDLDLARRLEAQGVLRKSA